MLAMIANPPPVTAQRASAGLIVTEGTPVSPQGRGYLWTPGIYTRDQVNGWRGETDSVEKIEKRVEHDLYYIENWSFLLDLKIIVQTILNVFKGEDKAY